MDAPANLFLVVFDDEWVCVHRVELLKDNDWYAAIGAFAAGRFGSEIAFVCETEVSCACVFVATFIVSFAAPCDVCAFTCVGYTGERYTGTLVFAVFDFLAATRK